MVSPHPVPVSSIILAPENGIRCLGPPRLWLSVHQIGTVRHVTSRRCILILKISLCLFDFCPAHEIFHSHFWIISRKQPYLSFQNIPSSCCWQNRLQHSNNVSQSSCDSPSLQAFQTWPRWHRCKQIAPSAEAYGLSGGNLACIIAGPGLSSKWPQQEPKYHNQGCYPVTMYCTLVEQKRLWMDGRHHVFVVGRSCTMDYNDEALHWWICKTLHSPVSIKKEYSRRVGSWLLTKYQLLTRLEPGEAMLVGITWAHRLQPRVVNMVESFIFTEISMNNQSVALNPHTKFILLAGQLTTSVSQ